MTTTWAPAPTIPTAPRADAWERALRALAHTMLRLAAGHAARRQQQARRQRVRQAWAQRRTRRAQDRALRRELARQLSPALRRDLGL